MSTRKKIIVIDDDKTTITMLTMILTKENYLVMSALDGEEGLEMIKSELPDLVVSDVLIPKIDGIDICEKIKKDPYLSHIKVILMTAIKNVMIQKEARTCGADGFIEKPTDSRQLLTMIKNLLEET
jgi:DNA-binding response OmpR family regulator